MLNKYSVRCPHKWCCSSNPLSRVRSNICSNHQALIIPGFDLPTQQLIPSRLNFQNLIVQPQGSRGVTPNTGTKYAVYTNTATSPYPTLTIDGTKTTSFDFQDFYVACLNTQTNKAVKCQFTLTSFLTTGQRQGPTLLSYTPASATGAKMTNIYVGSNGLGRAYWQLYTSDAPLEQTAILFDSLRYTIYTP